MPKVSKRSIKNKEPKTTIDFYEPRPLKMDAATAINKSLGLRGKKKLSPLDIGKIDDYGNKWLVKIEIKGWEPYFIPKSYFDDDHKNQEF